MPKLYSLHRYEAGTFQGVKLEMLGAFFNVLRCDSPDMRKVNGGHKWAIGLALRKRGRCWRFG